MSGGVNTWRATVLVCLLGAGAMWLDSSRGSGLRDGLGKRMDEVRRTLGSELNRLEDVLKDEARRIARRIPGAADRR